MKKFSVIVLAIFLLTFLGACGKNESFNENNNDRQETSASDNQNDADESGTKWVMLMPEGKNFDDYYKFVNFEDHPEGDFRDIALRDICLNRRV